MTKKYDLVIVGTGTAAMVAAMRVRAAGWSVAVIDFRPFGGTCALRGCDPKKMLVSGAEAVDFASRMRGNGVAGELSISWQDLIAFKRTLILFPRSTNNVTPRRTLIPFTDGRDSSAETQWRSVVIFSKAATS